MTLTTESPVKIGDIRAAISQTFKNHQLPHGYPTYRDLDTYDKDLPHMNGKKFSELIAERTGQTNILDIGCGQGIVLAKLMKDHPNVKGFGLSAYDFRNQAPTPWKDDVAKIDYRIADTHKLAKEFKDVEFDFVVSTYTFEWLTDPLLVLRQAYRKSKPGALILIDKFWPLLSEDQAKRLTDIWRENGIHAELHRWPPSGNQYEPARYSLAMQRGVEDKLPLPFRYQNIALTQGADTALDFKAHYRFDEAA